MHDLASDYRTSLGTRNKEAVAHQAEPEAMLRRQAALSEFCHRHRKRDLDAYKRAFSSWRMRLWRSWLTKHVMKATKDEEDRVRKSGLLDQGWYRLRYPNVRKHFSRHYITTGALEGADPHPLFDTDWYLERNSYPRKQGINPLAHYVTRGWRQGRSPHPMFDVEWYLRTYTEVAEKNVEPLRFYLNEGWRLGHQPHPLFDTTWYLRHYPDVEAAQINPLLHYVTVGVLEGYLPHPNAKADGKEEHPRTFFGRTHLITTLRSQHRRKLERGLKHMLEAQDFQGCITAFESYALGSDVCSEGFTFASQKVYVRALAREERATEAIQIAETLVDNAPRSPDRYSLLGYLLAGNEPSRARNLLRKALELGSTSITDVILIIRTYQIEQKDPVEALQDLESFADRHGLPPRGIVRDDYHMAMAAISAGTNKRECLDWLNRYYKLYGMSGISVSNPDDWNLDSLHFDVGAAHEKGPLVSVLMTSYNAEDHIEAALRSVLNQTHRNLEIILVDDCSSDQTVALAKKMAQVDPRLRVFVNRYNVGTYASKNVALRLANGEFITCHDSDDISHPEKIFRQVDILVKRPELLASISTWCRIDDGGSLITKRWGRIIHENPSSLMYRRKVVDSIGYYDCVRVSADTEYKERIRSYFGAKAIRKIPECMAFGRERLESLTVAAQFGFDGFGASPLRQAYWRSMKKWHSEAVMQDRQQLYLEFPPKEDKRHFSAPEEMITNLDAVRKNCLAHGLQDAPSLDSDKP